MKLYNLGKCPGKIGWEYRKAFSMLVEGFLMLFTIPFGKGVDAGSNTATSMCLSLGLKHRHDQERNATVRE